MRTSYLQYITMVEFMERHGDLSKPTGGPRGRYFIQAKWKELTGKLNSEGTGDSRSEDKWRKVWSDLKNNTKKKLAKINRAACGTGGGPALQLSMTDLENRVMQIIGVQAALGMMVVEAGFQQDNSERPFTPAISQPEALNPEEQIFNISLEAVANESWNRAGTSSQATVSPPTARVEMSKAASPSPPSLEESWKPPAPKRKAKDDISKLFVQSEKKAREYARERDIAFERLENERLRVHEFEVHERVRHRDLELQLQAQWMEFMRDALEVIKGYFEKEK